MLTSLESVMLTLGNNLKHWLNFNGKEGHWEGSQFKAKADLMAHDFLVAELGKLLPLVPIISEEDEISLVECRPKKYWLIDPIDGTASYVGGFSGYVTQVALIEDGEPTIAVVYAPELELLYSAQKGKGATLNRTSLPLLAPRASKILIDNYPEPRGVAQELFDGIACTGYVESGSLGLKLLRVADGTADVFVKNVIVRDWDLAPAQLILSEVGGQLSTLSGEKNMLSGSYEVEGIVCARTKELSLEIFEWLEGNSK